MPCTKQKDSSNGPWALGLSSDPASTTQSTDVHALLSKSLGLHIYQMEAKIPTLGEDELRGMPANSTVPRQLRSRLLSF